MAFQTNFVFVFVTVVLVVVLGLFSCSSYSVEYLVELLLSRSFLGMPGPKTRFRLSSMVLLDSFWSFLTCSQSSAAVAAFVSLTT